MKTSLDLMPHHWEQSIIFPFVAFGYLSHNLPGPFVDSCKVKAFMMYFTQYCSEIQSAGQWIKVDALNGRPLEPFLSTWTLGPRELGSQGLFDRFMYNFSDDLCCNLWVAWIFHEFCCDLDLVNCETFAFEFTYKLSSLQLFVRAKKCSHLQKI